MAEDNKNTGVGNGDELDNSFFNNSEHDDVDSESLGADDFSHDDFGDTFEDHYSEENSPADMDEHPEGDTENDSPQWNEDNGYGNSFDDESVYGDPNNVALPTEDDVFDHDGYSGGYGGKFSELPEDFDSESSQRSRRKGSGAFWWVVAGVSIATIALVTWGSLWMSTGEANPIAAVRGTTTSSSTESPTSNAQSPEQSIQEQGEGGDASASQQKRIEELEKSLTSAIDDADKVKGGSIVTRTNTSTKVENKTKTTTVNNTRTNTKTVTSTNRVTAPPPPAQTVTKTDKVRVPGPERTITTTVPTGRVTTTITTTVVERWG